MNDVDRATFFGLFKVLKIFCKALSCLKNPLKLGVEKLSDAVFIHFEIMRCGVGAVPTANAFRNFMSDTDHNVIDRGGLRFDDLVNLVIGAGFAIDLDCDRLPFVAFAGIDHFSAFFLGSHFFDSSFNDTGGVADDEEFIS